MYSQVLLCLAVVAPALSSLVITDPNGNTPWSAGVNQTIQWVEGTSGATLAQFGPSSLAIYVGNANQQTSLQTIANSVDVSTVFSYSFVPDSTIGPNSKDYFIRIQSNACHVGDSDVPCLGFSGKFQLTNMTGTFSSAVIAQINGQSTAPVGTPTIASGTSSLAPFSLSLTSSSPSSTSSTGGASGSGSGSGSSAAHPISTSGAIGVKAGWMATAAGALAVALLI